MHLYKSFSNRKVPNLSGFQTVYLARGGAACNIFWALARVSSIKQKPSTPFFAILINQQSDG